MGITSTELKVARVETPELLIVKAKVTMTEQTLIVRDRRSGRAIVDVVRDRTDVSGDTYEYGDITVIDTGGCGCGGTVITLKETV